MRLQGSVSLFTNPSISKKKTALVFFNIKEKRLANFYCAKRRSLLVERDVSKDEVC